MATKPKTTAPKAEAPTDTVFPLKLAGKDVTLTVSPAAMMTVSQMLGGLIPAAEKARSLDVSALAIIVYAGLGRSVTSQLDGPAIQAIMIDVCASDMVEVLGACNGMLARMIAGPTKVEG